MGFVFLLVLAALLALDLIMPDKPLITDIGKTKTNLIEQRPHKKKGIFRKSHTDAPPVENRRILAFHDRSQDGLKVPGGFAPPG
ncbi:MAG: hypothetical protein H6Q52_1129 [Deltaproteobacteria bacterium]|nr:hypothetical protein [Deltaproteobacteria bacterium]